MNYMMNYRKLQIKVVLTFLYCTILCIIAFITFLRAYRTTDVYYTIILLVTQLTYNQTIVHQLSAIYAIIATLKGIYFKLNQLNPNSKNRSSLIYSVKQFSSMYHYVYCAVQDFNCSFSLLHGFSIPLITFIMSFCAYVISRLLMSEDVRASYNLIIFFVFGCFVFLFVIGINCSALHDVEKEVKSIITHSNILFSVNFLILFNPNNRVKIYYI